MHRNCCMTAADRQESDCIPAHLHGRGVLHCDDAAGASAIENGDAQLARCLQAAECTGAGVRIREATKDRCGDAAAHADNDCS